jgi:exodeoxyribonuclease V alpha subunit
MEQRELSTLQGSVDEIIYRNEDSGFTVLDLDDGNDLVCVVGNLGNVQAGEELKLTGFYTTHPTYGYQFRAEVFERSLPATSNAICRYLSSGVVKGIGPVIARRIVEKFGDDTLKIIEQDPGCLAQVKGITKKRAEELAEEFKEVFGVRTLMMFLSGFGVSPAQSVRVWKTWGIRAMDLIRENPYILCRGEFQIEFAVTDQIGEACGVPKESYDRVLAGLSYVLTHNLNNGHTCSPRDKLLLTACRMLGLSEELVESRLEEILQKGELVSVKKRREFLALPELFEAESYIASRIALMVSMPPEEAPDIDFIIRQVEEEKHLTYAELQKSAMRQALMHEILILTGGPGTGKTTTLNGIIDILEYQGKRISIAAPTGRAAKRISEVTGREAKTIHRLLEVDFSSGKLKFSKNEEEPLDSDVIVIDEMSMVDVMLFDALLRAAKPGSKLILVGDYNQLPSVGAGNVLQDLLSCEEIPTVRLEHIFRQAAQSLIVTNAHSIVEGQFPDLSRKDGDFFFLSRKSSAAAGQTVLDLVCQRLPATYGYSPIEDIQVLCPQRKGELGVMELNKKLQNLLNPEAPGKVQFQSRFYLFRVGDKVMQVRNNYDIEWTKGQEKGAGIFNGDIGVIKMIDRGSQTLAIDFEERLAYYTFEMAEELELAYAVTVHKSQGSEFEAVVIPVIGGYDKLYYRNLLYTAITRAKKILILVGREDRIRFMVNNNLKSVRFTNLKYLLGQMLRQ